MEQHAPPQFTARTLDDYLEHLSKGVFQAGISWRVVDAKWPTITTAFHHFKVERVARMTEREIDALAKDERVIRSRPKIAAIVHNAQALLEIERERGFKKHLRSFDDYEPLAKDLKGRFKFVGDSGVYHFLWAVKHPVPDWHEWSEAHGMGWGKKAATATGGRTRPRGSSAPLPATTRKVPKKGTAAPKRKTSKVAK